MHKENLVSLIDQGHNYKKSQNSYRIFFTKGHRDYIATLSNGEAEILQGEDSDVKLTIPGGLEGPVIGHVHTHTQAILEQIPEEECLIAPVPEYHSDNICKGSQGNLFKIVIRHCAGQEFRKIIVRCGDFHNNVPFTPVPKKTKFTPNEGNHFTVDSEYISIYTSHFCQFVCTLCGIVCTGEVQVLLYGSSFLINQDTLVHLSMLYLCGPLYSIKDFRKVRKTHHVISIKAWPFKFRHLKWRF